MVFGVVQRSFGAVPTNTALVPEFRVKTTVALPTGAHDPAAGAPADVHVEDSAGSVHCTVAVTTWSLPIWLEASCGVSSTRASTVVTVSMPQVSVIVE